MSSRWRTRWSRRRGRNASATSVRAPDSRCTLPITGGRWRTWSSSAGACCTTRTGGSRPPDGRWTAVRCCASTVRRESTSPPCKHWTARSSPSTSPPTLISTASTPAAFRPTVAEGNGANAAGWRPRSRCRGLLWKLRAGALGDHVGGVPGRPVLVGLAGASFVLAVGSRGPLQRGLEVVDRRVRRLRRVHPAGQPRGDLLQQPGVAVGVAERREGAVAGSLVRRAGHASTRVANLELRAGRTRVEDLADLGAAVEQ